MKPRFDQTGFTSEISARDLSQNSNKEGTMMSSYGGEARIKEKIIDHKIKTKKKKEEIIKE